MKRVYIKHWERIEQFLEESDNGYIAPYYDDKSKRQVYLRRVMRLLDKHKPDEMFCLALNGVPNYILEPHIQVLNDSGLNWVLQITYFDLSKRCIEILNWTHNDDVQIYRFEKSDATFIKGFYDVLKNDIKVRIKIHEDLYLHSQNATLFDSFVNKYNSSFKLSYDQCHEEFDKLSQRELRTLWYKTPKGSTFKDFVKMRRKALAKISFWSLSICKIDLNKNGGKL